MEMSKVEQSRIFINSVINLLEMHLRQPVNIINLIDKTGYSRWYVQRKFCFGRYIDEVLHQIKENDRGGENDFIYRQEDHRYCT